MNTARPTDDLSTALRHLDDVERHALTVALAEARDVYAERRSTALAEVFAALVANVHDATLAVAADRRELAVDFARVIGVQAVNVDGPG